MTERSLINKKCTPCKGGIDPFSREQAQALCSHTPEWILSPDGKSISREYLVKNFMTAINFINVVANIAETENHHPDIHLTGYRKLVIELSTHKIGGLSENDFILAAKIDELPVELKTD